MRKIHRFAALSVGVAIAVTGCSDSDSDSSSDSSGSAAELTGEPVVITTTIDDPVYDINSPALKVAVDDVNANGGINGRPLQSEECNNNNDANTSAQCVRDGLAAGAVADVGSADNFGSASLPVLESAGVARFGNQPYNQADFTSPASYPIVGGGLGGISGQATFAVEELDAQDISVAYLDVAAGQTLPPLLNAAVLQPRGLELGTSVGIPIGAADISAQVAASTEGDPDAVLLALTQDLAAKYIRTARQQGYEGAIVAPAAVFSLPVIDEQLQGVTDDLYFIGGVSQEADDFDDFQAAMKDAGEEAAANEAAYTVWLAVHEFAEIAAGLPEITPEAFATALSQTTDLDTGGATPPLDFTTPGVALGGQAPRVFNSTSYGLIYEDGELKQTGDVIDPFGQLS
ncbi:ABC transporter substrate-binding protein [Blastococcus sp. URHD0036]|uniref:ABC transporter substrate-binding protein n=1 Tax=Blastococcus sp. URHD0036 TaxID=1380356 RepID=UPI00049826E2|nr:ABC transporter substrate-binding protein [Blastococcus sp. URHD0036]